MFDKLVESDTAGAEFKNRSRYFFVSTVVVGILFLSAVVWSLYATKVGLGDGDFEIAKLISPIDTVEPKKDELVERGSPSHSTPQIRNSNMARTDEPTVAPTSLSTVQNTQPARKWSSFNPSLPVSDGHGLPLQFGSVHRPPGTGSYVIPDAEKDERSEIKSTPPPEVRKSYRIMRTSKVLNGEAISLPKPRYPQPAVLLNLQGSVKVQVTIDEKGSVISAQAADGHPLFRAVAEQAARTAKFRPTLLNDEPVKVTGVIVYNFKRN